MTALNPHPAKAAVAPETETRRFSQLVGFRSRLYLTWAVLFGLCVMFFMSFDLKFSIIRYLLAPVHWTGVDTAPT
ncbi:hypothetical protein EMIT0196MI5_350015 [Pseudomonas sp. IT-196MI5]